MCHTQVQVAGRGLGGLIGPGNDSVHVQDKLSGGFVIEQVRKMENKVVQDLVYSSIDSGCHNNSCGCQNRDRTGERGPEGDG
jgi:hypothetical protein